MDNELDNECSVGAGLPFDAAPFGRLRAAGAGACPVLIWEDPREIHRLVLRFASAPPPDLALQYWRTRWPQQRLPKDRVPEGGAVGWWELGNWFTGAWQTADAAISVDGTVATILFHPLHAHEFPELADFPVPFRTTLQVRPVAASELPAIASIAAYTDSTWEMDSLTVLFAHPLRSEPSFTAFNGYVKMRSIDVSPAGRVPAASGTRSAYRVTVWRTRNTDPNTFDKTLLTIRWRPGGEKGEGKRGRQPKVAREKGKGSVGEGEEVLTLAIDDLAAGPVWVPDLGVCVCTAMEFIAREEERDYAGVCAAIAIRSPRGVYDAVAALPEQTWARAWQNMVPKREPFYLPLGTDGGRHRFGLNPDGSVFYRTNDRYLIRCPGPDTPAIQDDPGPDGQARIDVSFDLPRTPCQRTIQEGVLPISIAAWEVDGLRIEQEAFVTLLEGVEPQGPVPAGDGCGVFMARFTFRNLSDRPLRARLPIRFSRGGQKEGVRAELVPGDGGWLIWTVGAGLMRPGPVAARPRGYVWLEGGEIDAGSEGRDLAIPPERDVAYCATLAPGAQASFVLVLPYVWLACAALPGETDCHRSAFRAIETLQGLDFDEQRDAVAAYWRQRLDEGMRIITSETMLDEFHRAHAAHLLINCERAGERAGERVPDGSRRFARVGSFAYGAYGNESCMMIVDLDRRGYHSEARACLEAFLRGQGTVALPGDFASQEGVLYGAGGYECGGYNQHHGWILWCLVEHFKFTRDRAWLQGVAPNLLAAADWIVRERSRTLEWTGATCIGTMPVATTKEDDVGRGLLPHGSLEDIGDWWQWLSTNAYTWRGLDAAAWALEQIGHADAGRVRREADGYREAIWRAFTEAAQRAPVVRLRDGTCVPHFPSHVHRRGRCFGWICETLEGAIHLLIARLIDPHSCEALWVLKDYEDNLYLSPHYGYQIPDYEQRWFDWGGFSMQACLLLGAEPYLYRDDVQHALRAIWNAIAVDYYPDTRMLTEHALPRMGDWRGDHYKASDEANAAGWLRYLFIREEGEELLLGQAVPRAWLEPGKVVGVEKASTHFGPLSLLYQADEEGITATLHGPRRNPPARIRLRFRVPGGTRSVRCRASPRCEAQVATTEGQATKVATTEGQATKVATTEGQATKVATTEGQATKVATTEGPGREIAAFWVNGTRWPDVDGEWVLLPGDIGDVVVRAAFAF